MSEAKFSFIIKYIKAVLLLFFTDKATLSHCYRNISVKLVALQSRIYRFMFKSQA